MDIVTAIFIFLFLSVTFFPAYIVFWYFNIDPRIEVILEWWYSIFPIRSDPAIMRAISGHFDYYKKLDRENKKRFETRLMLFLRSKLFVERNGLVLNDQMKALIGACAIQITFGLRYYRLRYFHRIFVYPDAYHYRNSRVKFKGHVSDRGLIHLSWHHFEKGYLFPQDGVNLGLHEMAHALKLHAIEEAVDFEFYDNMEVWTKIARDHAEKAEVMKAFRKKDMDELWAVLVEHFFETPENFKNNLPELFNSMKVILNQDPLKPASPVIDGKRLKGRSIDFN